MGTDDKNGVGKWTLNRRKYDIVRPEERRTHWKNSGKNTALRIKMPQISSGVLGRLPWSWTSSWRPNVVRHPSWRLSAICERAETKPAEISTVAVRLDALSLEPILTRPRPLYGALLLPEQTEYAAVLKVSGYANPICLVERLVTDGVIDIIPLCVEVPELGIPIDATTVLDLIEILWRVWPVTDGTAFVSALVVCQEVLDGEKPAEEARKAFLGAALEAGVTVRPDVF